MYTYIETGSAKDMIYILCVSERDGLAVTILHMIEYYPLQTDWLNHMLVSQSASKRYRQKSELLITLDNHTI